jgi:N-acyl-D-aspartate/D-glutamate deacylase
MKKLCILLCLFSLLFFSASFASAQYDYIIKNGKVIDGMGNAWFKADVGIKGDKIIRIGIIDNTGNAEVLDASDRFVTPGFIDIHSHGERQVLTDRTVHNLVTQGATTIVGGNCGGSPLDMEKFFNEFEKEGASVNVGVLIGHNTVRRAVMGNEGRDPSETELDEMKRYVGKAMRAGALGISTGLKYRPGVYSKTYEVVELVKIAANYGGFYATHLRDEGLSLFESMVEAIEIAEEAGLPLQMSHHKAAGADMWGQTKTSLQIIETARKRGLDITTDLHPYPATFATCTIIFPPWAIEGTEEEVHARLTDPVTRKKDVDGIVYNIIHDRGGNNISNIMVGVHRADRSLEGMNLREILQMRGMPETKENAAELLIDLFLDGGCSCVFFCLSEDDIRRILQHPMAMYGSDAGNATMNVGKPHPRHYGHFPRIIAEHVRDRGDVKLEEAIRKMTSFSASRIGAFNRGIISEGKCADIVIFDLDRIQDRATFKNPHQYCEGIDYVMVNGQIVCDHGKITGKLPGKIIYGKGKTR